MQQVPAGCRWIGRGVGVDLHREFCEIAICEDGVVRSAGRVKTTPESLEAFAASLEPTDRVAMEVSGGAWAVARILEPQVQRVIVVSLDDTVLSDVLKRN
jgi:transposase